MLGTNKSPAALAGAHRAKDFTMTNVDTAAARPPASNVILLSGYRSPALSREEEDRLVTTFNNKLARKAGTPRHHGPKRPTREEERELIPKAQNGDLAARQRLALGNDWLVWELSKSFRSGRNVPDEIQRNELASISAFSDKPSEDAKRLLSDDDAAENTFDKAFRPSEDARRLSDYDVVAAGREGLLEAIDGFDLTQPYRLSTFAREYILGRIREAVKERRRRGEAGETRADPFVHSHGDATVEEVAAATKLKTPEAALKSAEAARVGSPPAMLKRIAREGASDFPARRSYGRDGRPLWRAHDVHEWIEANIEPIEITDADIAPLDLHFEPFEIGDLHDVIDIPKRAR
jgi:hypothetical protein